MSAAGGLSLRDACYPAFSHCSTNENEARAMVNMCLVVCTAGTQLVHHSQACTTYSRPQGIAKRGQRAAAAAPAGGRTAADPGGGDPQGNGPGSSTAGGECRPENALRAAAASSACKGSAQQQRHLTCISPSPTRGTLPQTAAVA